MKDYQRLIGSGGKKANRAQASTQPHVAETPIAFVQSIPSYSAYVPVRRAISCADDPLLRYVCYFGENDYEDVMADVYEVENVDTQGKNQSQERIAEMYEQEDAVIEQYLIRQASLGRRTVLDKAEMDQLESGLDRPVQILKPRLCRLPEERVAQRILRKRMRANPLWRASCV